MPKQAGFAEKQRVNVLHMALNGEADTLVTGDADLLVLHPFHGIEILSPADFLAQTG